MQIGGSKHDPIGYNTTGRFQTRDPGLNAGCTWNPGETRITMGEHINREIRRETCNMGKTHNHDKHATRKSVDTNTGSGNPRVTNIQPGVCNPGLQTRGLLTESYCVLMIGLAINMWLLVIIGCREVPAVCR